jgi:nucleotide-binding universal stress UspA family protein
MNTILVATDFSATAKNAADYALALGKQLKASKLILYNAYQAIVLGDAMASTTIVLNDIELEEEMSNKGLEAERKRLALLSTPDISIETFNAYHSLVGNIQEVCTQKGIDLIVMGISGSSALAETLIGSNTLSVSKHTKVPLIIVPPDANFKPIEKVLLTCDYTDVSNTLPVEVMTSFLISTAAELHVLHVEKNDKDYSNETVFESVALETLLGQFNPAYHFMNNNNFAEAVNSFAEENDISIVAVLPKKHHLLDSLLHKSHTKILAFHSHIPLLVVHE